jgi:hypothetical protein
MRAVTLLVVLAATAAVSGSPGFRRDAAGALSWMSDLVLDSCKKRPEDLVPDASDASRERDQDYHDDLCRYVRRSVA